MLNLISSTIITIVLISNNLFAKNNLDYLTQEEQSYLKNKKELTVCVKKGWSPFENLENDKFVGISADFMYIYSDILSTPLKIIKIENQTDSLKYLSEGRCDIKPLLAIAVQSPIPYTNTQAYIHDKIVLVTRMEQAFIRNLDILKYKNIVVVKGYKRFIKYIQEKYPSLNILKVSDIDSALKLVATGDTFGYMGASLVAGSAIAKNFSSQLKIVNDFEDFEFGMGVLNSEPTLLSILNKTMNQIPEYKKLEIYNRWISATIEKEVDNGLLYKFVGILLFFILLGIYRQSILHKYNKKLQATQDDFNLGQEISNMGIWHYTHYNDKLVWSEGIHKILETNSNNFKVSFESFLKQVHPDDLDMINHAYNDSIKNKSDYYLIHRILTSAGYIKYVEGRCQNFFDYNGDIIKSIGSMLDITEKVKIEKELESLNNELENRISLQVEEIKKSNSLFETIFNTVKDGIAILDLKSNFLVVNEVYELMTGYTKNELYKTSCIALTTPDMIEESKKIVSTVFEKGFYRNFKKKCILKNGKISHVMMDLVLMEDKKRILIITKDITQEVINKEKQKTKDDNSKHQLKLFQMGEAISTMGLQAEYVNYEEFIQKVIKTAATTMNTSRLSIWLYQKNQTELKCLNLYTKETGRYSSGLILTAKENPLYFKTLTLGKTIVVNDAQKHEKTLSFNNTYLKPLDIKSMLDVPITRDGKVIGVVCNECVNELREWTKDEIIFSKAIANSISLAMEIEYRKETAILLKEKTKEQEILLSLFDMGSSVLFKWNNDDVWSVGYVSKSVKSVLGYEKDEFMSDSITYASCIHKDDLAQVKEEVTEASTTDKDFFKHEPYRVIHKDGTTRWVLDYTVILRDNDGGIINYLGYISDITELRQKDQQLVEQNRLAQMGEMISMIAHQWRQPLNAISLTSNNLQLKLIMDNVDNDYFTKEIRLIDNYSQHLSKTIDDFRNFFKKGKEKELTTTKEMVFSVLEIVQVSLENKNIQIDIENLEDENSFKTYVNEVKQVILNLIKNAEDALLDSNIENPKISITSAYINAKNILSIKDNAGGVPEDIISKIFDPYFSTKLEKDGTGLGLYMSKTIIENHCSGKLLVSNDTEGAVFSIEFNSKIDTNGGG